MRLLSYHDLVEATEPAMRALALALGLDWDACLTRATLGGRPTGGNASDGRAEACGPRGLWQGRYPGRAFHADGGGIDLARACSLVRLRPRGTGRMTGRVIDGRDADQWLAMTRALTGRDPYFSLAYHRAFRSRPNLAPSSLKTAGTVCSIHFYCIP